MKIIGLTGFAKSGKSTAAQILKEMGGQEVAFAKHLKDVCSVVFGIPRDHFDNQAYKEVLFTDDGDLHPITIKDQDIFEILTHFEVDKRFYPAAILSHAGIKLTSPRHVAQYVGTEVLRSIDTDIHIKMAFKLNEGSNAKFLICSDVRFDNELKAVQESGGVVFGIHRDQVVPKNIDNLHPSEKEIPDLILKSNSTIINDGTIESLQNEVIKLAKSYLNSK